MIRAEIDYPYHLWYSDLKKFEFGRIDSKRLVHFKISSFLQIFLWFQWFKFNKLNVLTEWHGMWRIHAAREMNKINNHHSNITTITNFTQRKRKTEFAFFSLISAKFPIFGIFMRWYVILCIWAQRLKLRYFFVPRESRSWKNMC